MRLPNPAVLLVWALGAVFGWGTLFLIGYGCVALVRAPQPPPFFDMAKSATAEQALAPKLWPAVRSLLVDDAPAFGYVRTLGGPTVCDSTIPLPYIVPNGRVPVVGQEWECLFATSVSSVPPEPDWFAWLVVSDRPPDPVLPLELSPIGLPGCQLQVNLDQLIGVPPGFEAPGALLRRVPGRGQILLRWTPAPGMGGAKLWIQLLVHSPGRSPGGFLVSHAIELGVGS